MPNPRVTFVVSLTIPEENFAKFESLVQSMTAGTQTEPGTLVYDWCLSRDRKRCRLLETYVDGNAVLEHINGPVVKDLVPKLLQITTLTGFEVFGDPGPKASEALANVGAEVFSIWRGVTR